MRGIIDYPYNRELMEMVLTQKKKHTKNSIYHFLQVTFAYNSNHIEGSTLTPVQTESIYDKGEIQGQAKVKDILEVKNHFALFDYMLETINSPLSEKLIKDYHRLLKLGIDFDAGEFKTAENQIGFINPIATTPVKNVSSEIQRIIDNWECSSTHSFEDIVDFHVKFESIHPFQDGNGRIGRIIMFKECIRNNIFPILVYDELKRPYVDGIKNWRNNNKIQLLQTLNLCQETLYQNTLYFIGRETELLSPFGRIKQFNEESSKRLTCDEPDER